jgi:hypothetical protein
MLQAIGSALVTILAVVFIAGMCAGCAATVTAHRALRGSR